MKKSKILSIALCAVVTASAIGMSGCIKDDPDNTATNVQIYYWKSGLGEEWIQEVVDKYNQAQTKYTATLEYDENATTIINTLSLGEGNNFDLYLCMLNNMQYKEDFIKLDSVLDSKAFGEEKTVREKYYPYLLNGVTEADSTTTFLTYGNSWCGIVYNTDVIDGVQYQVPRTTDELERLTTKLSNDKKTPWLFFNSNGGANGYMNYVTTGWAAQYEGLDKYNNVFMQLDGETDAQKKEMLLSKDGRYQALKVCESILTPNTVHPEHSNTNFTKVQTLFLNGEAVMMPNGGWLLNETSGTANVSMMKLPVISAITEKLEDRDMDDATLAQIIDEVDAGKTSSELCSQNDFDRIKQARNILCNNGADQYVFIPKYSNVIDGAKDFLTFLYSDEGLASFMKHTSSPAAAQLTDKSKFDVSTLSAWGQRQFALTEELTAVTSLINKSSIFTDTGLDGFLGLDYSLPLCSNNPNQRKDADQLWTELVNKVNENWEDWNR
jgi:ABC-type glycerol-3-phosphate transport system substrate-binding protein